MTNTPALGADKATDELKNLLTAATNASFDCGAHDCDDDDNPDVVPYEELARIAHEKREAVLDFFRAALVAVPASEPVDDSKAALREAISEYVHASEDLMRDLPQNDAKKRWIEAQEELEVVINGIFAQSAPVSDSVAARPQLAGLTRFEPDPDYEDMRYDRDGDYVRLADVEALFPAPQAPDTPNHTGEKK